MRKSRILHTIITALITGAALYAGILILLYIFQSRLVFFPSRDLIANPNQIGLEYEEVDFKTSDHLGLSGWFVPNEESEYVILFCHGNAGNISHRLDTIRMYYQLGLSIFIFDYRGYGKSEGSPSEKGTYVDARAAWEYLSNEKGYPPGKIIIGGRSLGGAIAAWLASKQSPAALILESTFTSIPDAGAVHYPIFPIKLLARIKYNTLEYIKDVNRPLLVIHSKTDDLIPFRHGKKLYSAYHGEKQFLEIHGDHNEGFIESESMYMEGLRNFLKKFVLE
ncbi:MAG: alpha/beta fold hydrolase [candidate division Zixibacteria bacterium]|nr:alpha/beta fold hydrolase [candidate division Zixibacteria bacterium]